jgi:hypothetical protein
VEVGSGQTLDLAVKACHGKNTISLPTFVNYKHKKSLYNDDPYTEMLRETVFTTLRLNLRNLRMGPKS